jgi:hypothetical protein
MHLPDDRFVAAAGPQTNIGFATIALMILVTIASLSAPGAFAAKQGGGGGGAEPPVCDPNAQFPYVLFHDSTTNSLVLGSSDGCITREVVTGVQSLSYHLNYPTLEGTGVGLIDWVEFNSGGFATVIRRMRFSISGTDVIPYPVEVLYRGQDYLLGYDTLVTADSETLILAISDALLVFDAGMCADNGGCESNDGSVVYDPVNAATCLSDPEILEDCYSLEAGGVAISPAGDAAYFGVRAHIANDDPHPQAPDSLRVDSVASVAYGANGWELQTPILILDGRTHSPYRNIWVGSVSENGQYVSAGAEAEGLIFYDVTGNPDELTTDLVQHAADGVGSWTPDNKVLIWVNEGKRRSLKSRMQILDPASGDTVRTELLLNSGSRLDSAL